MDNEFENDFLNNGTDEYKPEDSFSVKPFEEAAPQEPVYDSEPTQFVSGNTPVEPEAPANDFSFDDFVASVNEAAPEEETVAEPSAYTAPETPAYTAPEAPAYKAPEEPPVRPQQPFATGYRTASQGGGAQFYNNAQNTQPSQPTQPYNFSGSSYTQPYNGGSAPVPEAPKGNGKKILAIVLSVVVVLAVVLGFLVKSKSNSTSNPSTTTTAIATETVTDAQGEAVTNSDGVAETVTATAPVQYATNTSTGSTLTPVQIADKCRSSVVGVMTYESGQLSGEGSGVVMGFDSTNTYTYIMTCAHVISDSGVTYGILTLDGTSYEAELVGYDSRTDIGVLKVEGTNFTVAEFGDSTQLKIGEAVYAIGNPGGSEYFGSMTEGIVSAIDRTVSGTYNITCIQHDAAINPGNSGGALVNSLGQVIGINSSKIASTDYEGMGFAVPSATSVSVAENLIKYGYVPNRPKLGITYSDVSKYQVYSMVVAIKNLPAGSLIITGISDDSAFVGTKAEVGDMIIAVNGEKMNSSNVLLDLIDKGAVGDTLTLTLCRVNSRTYATSEFDVTIKLVEDKGSSTTEEATSSSLYGQNGGNGSYDSGSYGDFSDFFKQYFGF